MKRLMPLLGIFMGTILAFGIVSMVKQAMLLHSAYSGKVYLVRPAASVQSGRCAILGSTYRKGQPFPFYDKLWLMSGKNGKLLSNSRESNSRNCVTIKNPTWNPSGNQLVWLKSAMPGDSLVVYNATTRRIQSKPVPNSIYSILLGSATATRDPSTWPTDKSLSLDLIGWYPDGKHVMVQSRLYKKTGKLMSAALWKVGVDRDYVGRVMVLNPKCVVFPFDKSLAVCGEKMLLVYDKVYELPEGKDAGWADPLISDAFEIKSAGKNAAYITLINGKKYSLVRLDLTNRRKTLLLESYGPMRHLQVDGKGIPFVELQDGNLSYSIVAVTSPGHATKISKTTALSVCSLGRDNNGNSIIWITNIKGDKVERLQLNGLKVANRTSIPLSQFQLR